MLVAFILAGDVDADRNCFRAGQAAARAAEAPCRLAARPLTMAPPAPRPCPARRTDAARRVQLDRDAARGGCRHDVPHAHVRAGLARARPHPGLQLLRSSARRAGARQLAAAGAASSVSDE